MKRAIPYTHEVQIRHPLPWVEVIAQARLLKVKIRRPSGPPCPGTTRGVITDFSNESRKRMLELLSRLDETKAGFVCFITLTYPDRDGPPDTEATERDRQTFFKRMKRRFPDTSAIWRRERKARRSGGHVGLVYPHYHFIFFNTPFIHHAALNLIWQEVVGYSDYVRTEIKAIESWTQVTFYVSKYMAKYEEAIPPSVEHDAGATRADAGRGSARSLVSVANLTGTDIKREEEDRLEEEKPESQGRAWGAFNRSKLPFGEVKTGCFALGPWYPVAKLHAKGVWPLLDELGVESFTLFLDHADQMLDLFDFLYETQPYLDQDSDDAFIGEGGDGHA